MKFEIYEDESGQFRWRLVAANGRNVGNGSEGYVSKGNCEKAVKRVLRGVFEIYMERDTDAAENAAELAGMQEAKN